MKLYVALAAYSLMMAPFLVWSRQGGKPDPDLDAVDAALEKRRVMLLTDDQEVALRTLMRYSANALGAVRDEKDRDELRACLAILRCHPRLR